MTSDTLLQLAVQNRVVVLEGEALSEFFSTAYWEFRDLFGGASGNSPYWQPGADIEPVQKVAITLLSRAPNGQIQIGLDFFDSEGAGLGTTVM